MIKGRRYKIKDKRERYKDICKSGYDKRTETDKTERENR